MGRQGGAGPGSGPTGEAVFAVLLDHDRHARPARDDRHRCRPVHGSLSVARALLAGLLFAGRCDRALLALCRYGLDLPAADALPAWHPHAREFPFLEEAAMAERVLSPVTYVIVCVVLVVLTILTLSVSF